LIFNEYIDKFEHFYRDNILEEEEMQPTGSTNPDMSDTMPISDSIVNDSSENEVKKDSVLVPAGN